MRILIAPTKNTTDLESYIKWVEHYGFTAQILKEDSEIDAPLLLCGGADIGKNSQRDMIELEWIRMAIKANQPIIGICRGMQILNYHFGGMVESLDEAINEDHTCDDFTDDNNHVNRISHYHWVIDEDGRVDRVNSRHHQYCSEVADNFIVTHTSLGGGYIPEAIKDEKLKIWAVQWHPERFEMTDNSYPLNML